MDQAQTVAPEMAAEEAVKAYLRMHRGRLDDPEWLALMLPERFGAAPNISDYQRYVIDRLLAENATLKAERDGVRFTSKRAALTREGVRKLVLALIEARGFAEAVAVAMGAAAALGADQVSLGIESDAPIELGEHGLCLLPPGLSDQLIERDAAGALLKGNAHAALFPGTHPLQCVAVFRLRLGAGRPSALYAVGARDAARFDDESETREIAYFVRALERAICAWLDLPRN